MKTQYPIILILVPFLYASCNKPSASESSNQETKKIAELEAQLQQVKAHSAAATPTPDQALTDDIILSELHNNSHPHWYPQTSSPGSYNFGGNDPLAAECRKLINDHFVESTQMTMGWHHATEKGKQIYLSDEQTIYYDSFYHNYILNLTPYIIDISTITDKLIDSKAGTATIKCNLKRTPTTYVQHLIQIKPSFANDIAQQQFQSEMAFQFRRWDSGWRLEGE